MKRNVILLLSICAFALAVVAFLWWRTDLGVSSAEIEKDARSEQQIPGNWNVAKDVGNLMTAMIFYDESRSDFTVAIYAKQSEASDKYHCRYGGVSGMIGTGIVEFSFEDCEEQAFLSMNEQKAVQAVIFRGEETQNRALDADNPFVLVLGEDVTEVIFYDANGNIAGDYEIAAK